MSLVGSNQINTGSEPLKIFNLKNVTNVAYTATDLNGQVVFTGSESCVNGFENGELEIDVPTSLAVAWYHLLVATSNDCDVCIKNISWLNEDFYLGQINQCDCRNTGIIRPCCENYFEADQYAIACNENFVEYVAINDLEVGTTQDFEVLAGTMASFEAGSSIVFGSNFETQPGSEMTAEVTTCTQNKKGETGNRMANNVSGLFENSEDILCFPNPSNGTINMLSQWPEQTEVVVYNLLGQMVQSLQIDEYEMSSINLPNSGMYNVVFLNGGQRIVKKVIVN